MQHDPTPWSVAGGPDLSYSDEARTDTLRLLTDPGLGVSFQHTHRRVEPTDYEAIIRLMNLVWDCPDDAAVNATGYRCAGCFAGRAALELAERCRDDRRRAPRRRPAA